jgi:hypothetical protein
VTYPAQLNPEVKWPSGAAFGVAICKEHDAAMIEILCTNPNADDEDDEGDEGDEDTLEAKKARVGS